MKSRFLLAILLGLLSLRAFADPLESRPRLLVLTDIGGDPDDQQSLIRLLHYANEFEIEGFVASASGTIGELKVKTTRPDLIREMVQAYAKVWTKLSRQAPGYPEPEVVLSRIKSGSSDRGLPAIGDGKDTEGSRWIIAAADRPDSRPLNISIWGGQTDLAQALWRVRHDRDQGGFNRFVQRLRIFDIGDQDRIASWIWQEFPGLFYILSAAPQGIDKREGAYRGMYLGGNESLVSRDWMNSHIRTGHGPLGALYPDRTWTAPNPYSAIKEGDTPSWFFFLRNGLNDAAHPEWGGWGGRYTNAFDHIYRDARDAVQSTTDARATVWRWRPAFQSDFAARLDWAVAETVAAANHPPTILVNGIAAPEIVQVQGRSGESLDLAVETSDPDSNRVRIRWFEYSEAGSFHEKIPLVNPDQSVCTVRLALVTKAETMHLICEATDDGVPALSAFRRVIISITP